METLNQFKINWSEFSWSEYGQSEQRFIKPVLEAAGYHSIRFSMGESDSFGPLSRIVHAMDAKGVIHLFYYG